MKEETIIEILLDLSSSIGVSGSETAAVETAARYFRQYSANVKRDRFGNLLALICGEPQMEGERLTIAVVAHIDEIGAMITKIEPEGFLRFTPVGGIDPRTILGQTVVVSGKKPLQGVIGAAPPHLLSDQERSEVVPIDKLFIDVGLTGEKANELLAVGDFISFEQQPLYIEGNRKITGKSLDNRAGVTAMLICAAELASMRHQADVCFVASLQEEVGLRGAVTSAYGLKPDLALIVDVTHGDAPGLDDSNSFKLGSGPALAVGPNLHPALADKLQETARRHFLPWQKEPIPGHSGTDAWAFQVSREGIPSALLSIPLRYMHTAVELLSLDDLIVCGKLLSHFIQSVDRSLLEDMKKC